MPDLNIMSSKTEISTASQECVARLLAENPLLTHERAIAMCKQQMLQATGHGSTRVEGR